MKIGVIILDKGWILYSMVVGLLMAIGIVVSGSTAGAAASWGALAFLFCVAFDVVHAINAAYNKRETSRKAKKTFGFSTSSKEAVVLRTTVIQRLIESWRALNELVDSKNSVARKWAEASLETGDGVEHRLALQREYDEASRRLREAKERFERVCEVAMEAGFREEVRAFGYPKVTVKSGAQDAYAPTIVAAAAAMAAMS